MILFLIGLYKPSNIKKPFVILISREPDVFTNLFMKQGISLLVNKALFRNLVELDDNLKYYPELVKEVPTIENNLVTITSDGKMHVKWRFKKNLKWSDGHPLTPEDVLFTYQVLMHPKVAVLGIEKSDAKFIDSIKIMDDGNTLLVVWKKLYYNYLTAHPILPKHLLEKHLIENPSGFDSLSYHRFPVGNGPYRISKWKPGSYILLKANEYYQKKANVPAIAFKMVKDVNSILVNLISGEGDACTTLSPEQYFFLKKRYTNKINVYLTEGMQWLHIDLNLQNKILKDINVRKALLYSIDRNTIAKIVSHNTYSVSNSWLPSKHYGYNNPSLKYSFDPDKGESLLKKSGWKYNSGNILEKNGKTLSLTLLTDSNDKDRGRIAVFIKEYLRKIGVDLKIESNTTNILFSKYFPERDFDLGLYAWSMWPRIDGEYYWMSNKIPTPQNKRSGLNFSGFTNIEIDNIHKILSRTLNYKKRLELFKHHQEIWINELPALPLFIIQSLSATRKGVLNWKPTGSAIPVTWNCEKWIIK